MPIELVFLCGEPTPLFKPVVCVLVPVPVLKPVPAVIPVLFKEPPPIEPALGLAAPRPPDTPPAPAPAPPPPVPCANAHVEPRARTAANAIVVNIMVLSFLERWDNNRGYSIAPKFTATVAV